MKKDDEHTKDNDSKPKYDLDADAANEPDVVINLPAKKPGYLSVNEWSELKKRDPSTLTPAQRKSVEKADADLKDAIKRISPKLTELTRFGGAVSEAFSKKSQFSSIIENLALSPPMIEPPRSFIDDMKPSDFAVVARPTAEQQDKQTMLLERLVEGFEAQNAERNADTQRLLTPSYDAKNRILIFANTIIDIPIGDQELVCKALFRTGKPVSKPIGIGDVLIKMGVGIDQIKGNKRVHYAKAHLNTTVAKKVHVDDLFEIENKHIWFNQKYL